jgi:hypothetical protein
MCLFAHKNDILNIFRRVRINMEKRILVSSNLSFCLSVSLSACLSVYLSISLSICMYHLGSHWMDLYEILYWGLVIRKAVENLHILIQSINNIWHFTWRPKTHILKSNSNKLYNFSKIWHSYLLHPLSVAIFREYKYLKSYSNLWYRWLVINGNTPICY